MGQFLHTKNEVTYKVRAKYYPTADGGLKLAQIQKFSSPRFRPKGWELVDEHDPAEYQPRADIQHDPADVARASRRAKTNAFDIIMSNPDLDMFCTFTYSPESVDSKASYDECYRKLAVWLSNRVQRRDLKYVITPELTKIGDIHFHAIMNESALRLTRAINPHTQKPLKHDGKALYNITDWEYGFTSCERISRGSDDRAKVSKYIFKYMGKQMGQKIGGRYVLIGGDLIRPTYLYADDENELMTDAKPLYQRTCVMDDIATTYSEWSFV